MIGGIFDMSKGEKRTRARQLFTSTLQSPYSKCEYCEKPIVWKELLNQDLTFIRDNVTHLSWLENGIEVLFLKATIDHIKPLSKGGNNTLINLAGSCFECNQAKDGLIRDKHCKYCQTTLTPNDFRRSCKKCAERKAPIRPPKWKRKIGQKRVKLRQFFGEAFKENVKNETTK